MKILKVDTIALIAALIFFLGILLYSFSMFYTVKNVITWYHIAIIVGVVMLSLAPTKNAFVDSATDETKKIDSMNLFQLGAIALAVVGVLYGKLDNTGDIVLLLSASSSLFFIGTGLITMLSEIFNKNKLSIQYAYLKLAFITLGGFDLLLAVINLLRTYILK